MASPSTFSQVIFNNIPKTYTGSTTVTCHYTLAVGFQPTTRDWVGIFKVGWSTTKDYYNFVWVDPPVDLVEEEPVRKQSLFREYYLPKEESEFYQFCYVDGVGHVKGASTPFSFRYPVENVDCSLETDLLVVTTQDEVDQSAREKEELMKTLEQLRMGSRSLERALEEREREMACLKEQSKERDKKESELAEELNQAREQNKGMALRLKEKEQEAEGLMILIQTKNHLEHDQHNASEKEKPEINTASEAEIQEKYDQAVIQIHQLKAELEQLRGRNTQSEEIAELKAKVRGEEEEELIRLKDMIQLLEVDLKCSERDTERLSAELNQLKSLTLDMEQLKSENQELRQSLSQQESRHNRQDQDYKAQCNTMIVQLGNTRTQLANERKESNDKRRQAEEVKRELLDAKEQLHKAAMEIDQIKQKSVQLESRLAESRDIIAEKDAEIARINGVIELRENRLKIHNQEKEQLVRDNQSRLAEINEIVELRENRLKIQNQEKEQLVQDNQRLRTSVEELRRELMDLQAAVSAGYSQPEWPAGRTPPAQYEEPHNIMGSGPNTQERRMVCRSCHAFFPGVTQEELDQHEQSHRVCPFCTLICDHMEQSDFEQHVYSHEL